MRSLALQFALLLLLRCSGKSDASQSKLDLRRLTYSLRPKEIVVNATESFQRPRYLQQVQMVFITIAILFDAFPQEVGISISDTDYDRLILQYDTGHFSEITWATGLFQQTLQVQQGRQYSFVITDSYGDGMSEPAYFAIFYGSESGDASKELLRSTNFGKARQEHLFRAELPINLPSSPTSRPTSTNPPAHAPSTCVRGNDQNWRVTSNRRDYTPHYQTPQSAFPLTQAYCQLHSDYKSCTNERREDCQWIFLGVGARSGLCRVNPITKCLITGNCLCQTQDFNSGPASMGGGLLFHVPISITSRDIAPASQVYYHYEEWTTEHSHPLHPQDPTFFISRVDFTSRKLTYRFQTALDSPNTISFNLHYLYWDVPVKGQIWRGQGYDIQINTETSPPVLTLNSKDYRLERDLKKWTCTTVVITPSLIYIAGIIYIRGGEQRLTHSDQRLILGPVEAELFDVRIHKGTLNDFEIRELGTRCTIPEDEAALRYKRDIENPYFVYRCDADFVRLPPEEVGPATRDGRQTYGSSAFSTLWTKPTEDPSNPGTFMDVSEGEFDEEWFFQHHKLQSHLYERFYMELDMIAFNQQPYRYHANEQEVPVWSESFWNNPCRYISSFNNGWQFPIYGQNISKFGSDHGNNGVFDLAYLYKTRNVYKSMAFFVHEMFHGLQGHLIDIYSGAGSLWLAETSAEFSADYVFPTTEKIISPLAYAPSLPLGFMQYRDAERGQHFMSDELSISDWIRGGTVYGSWLLWWFLAEHAGLPHVLGQLYSTWYNRNAHIAGEIFQVRQIVENANMDFGDVWSIAVAHMRTWDFPQRSSDYRKAEEEDFRFYQTNPDVQPPIPSTYTVESRKTTVEIDEVSGTSGFFVSGPEALWPGPNAHNCLSLRDVTSGRVVSISIIWDDGMGFQDGQQPTWLKAQQEGCDDDPRFYNSVVVAHNKESDQRRYWKLKGKEPETLHVRTSGVETFHIILVPTPPTDYVMGMYSRTDNGYDDRMSPIPIYSYRYRVDVSDDVPEGAALAPEAEKQYGIVRFDDATEGWWPVRCTCMDQPGSNLERCVRPTFDGVGVPRPTAPMPTPFPTRRAPAAAIPSSPSLVPTPRSVVDRTPTPAVEMSSGSSWKEGSFASLWVWVSLLVLLAVANR